MAVALTPVLVVVVGAGAAAGLAGESVRLAAVDVLAGVAFASGVAAKLDSVVVGGVETSGLGTVAFGCGCSGFVVDGAACFCAAGCAIFDEMIAGSAVGPLGAAGFAAGALRPGG